MSKTGNSRMVITLCGVLVVLWSCGPVAKADYVYGEAVKVPNINTTSGDSGPSITADGLELYFSSSHPYGGDLCHSDIWVLTRPTVKDAWGAPRKLDPPVNSAASETNPCISADGLELYFSDGWSAAFLSGCSNRPGGYGYVDLWVSTRATRQDPWGVPRNLGPVVNSNLEEDAPSISSDGLSLYFYSNRMGIGTTHFDLYVTKRQTKNDPWGPAVKLGAPIPTVGNQLSPSISRDDLSLYFANAEDYSTFDVYVSRRASVTAPWETPVPFKPVNSSLSEYGVTFAPGSSTLYFSRSSNWNPADRASYATTVGTLDIWQIEVIPIVDFNADGKVDLVDLVMLIENWGMNDPLYDIGPMPLGDGKVDLEDLKVFMTYYEKENPPKAQDGK